MSMDELLEKRKAIEADPKNRMPSGSLYLYTPNARKRLDKIDLEIANLIRERRAAEGRPVPCDGYSGRQTKRR